MPPLRRGAAVTAAGALLVAGSGVTTPVAADPAAASAPAAAAVRAQVRTPMPGVWWYDAMKLGEVHRTATGQGVKVAVIDGYLDRGVPDLEGADISKGTSCRNGETPYLSGDQSDHGTAMTTAIVGQGRGNAAGGKGVVGVAPDAQLRFYSFDTDPSNTLVECDAILIAQQIDKAVEWGADVISMSIGTGGGLEESIERAWDSGAVVVAATGVVDADEKRAEAAFANPASMPGVVAVGAADSRARMWSQSPQSSADWDEAVTVAAPGVATPLGGVPEGKSWTSGAVRTGTSGATAITAGAFAVLKSRWPEATGNQLVQSVIHHTGDNDSNGLEFDKRSGYGILSLLGTLDVDPTGYPDENPLLLTPPEAAEKYPASVYDASGGAQAEDDQGDDQGSDQGVDTATAQDGGASASADTGAAGEPTDGGSVPVWAIALGILVLAGGAAAALVARRRSRPADTTTTTTYDDEHTAPRGS